VLAVALSTHLGFAQGILRGSVSDSVAREALVGANVHLKGTAFGAVSDREGKYRITDITPGSYVIRIAYIGYKSRLLLHNN